MTRPEVVDRDGFQIWTESANTLNKQSQTTEKRWSSRLWIGRSSKNLST